MGRCRQQTRSPRAAVCQRQAGLCQGRGGWHDASLEHRPPGRNARPQNLSGMRVGFAPAADIGTPPETRPSPAGGDHAAKGRYWARIQGEESTQSGSFGRLLQGSRIVAASIADCRHGTWVGIAESSHRHGGPEREVWSRRLRQRTLLAQLVDTINRAGS